MEISMDGRNEAGLRSSSGRKTREDALLEWWRNYRAIEGGGSRSLQVRDKVDGSNRYGVIPWEVPLRDQGVTPVGELEEPEAVHSGYTYVQFGSRRQRDGRRRGNRQR